MTLPQIALGVTFVVAVLLWMAWKAGDAIEPFDAAQDDPSTRSGQSE